ncbi:MAG TPA: heme-binding protein, partial [Planctomycetaceae bacterium]|nr:heme-binding protein [Planctomycetaceae bacterium]
MRLTLHHFCPLFVAAFVFGAGTLLAQETSDGKLFTQKPEIAPAAGQPMPEQETKPKPDALNQGPTPSWIWGTDPNKKYVVRKKFTGTAQFALLQASCDNIMTVWVNGAKVASSDNWKEPVETDIKSRLKPGENVIEAEIANAGGSAGFVAKIALLGRDGKDRFVVTDDSWEIAESRDAKEWGKAKVIAKYGDKPWGDVFAAASSGDGGQREVFNVLPGFQVEKLFTVPKEKLGSWVNITSDPK